jgi:hypothetical protein
LVPFSAGPAACPARNLVLFLAAAWLAELVRERSAVLPRSHGLDPAKLPATFDHFSLRLGLSPIPRVAQERAPRSAVERSISQGGFDG